MPDDTLYDEIATARHALTRARDRVKTAAKGRMLPEESVLYERIAAAINAVDLIPV